jgi:hypothetical protein
MYFYLTGKELQQPSSASSYSRSEVEQLFTFGERVNPELGLNINPEHSHLLENWSVINHSASGFRLGSNDSAQKIRHGQLMAICPHDGERFLLAQATWLMQEASGGMILGVATLPGLPVGVGSCLTSGNGPSGHRRIPAFLLPPVPVFKEEASLVLPSGTYQSMGTP